VRDILSVNTGSSSIKIDVFVSHDSQDTQKKYSVSVEDIGQAENILTLKDSSGTEKAARTLQECDFATATEEALNVLQDFYSLKNISAVGVRFVHSGPNITQHCIVTNDTINELLAWEDLDPTHLPATLTVLTSLQEQLPQVPYVGCFDTVFFAEIPKVAQTIAIPHAIDDPGIKRYGFHGLSYSYIRDSFRANEGKSATNGRVIMAHLGSGASITALKDGKPVDMTMGFTPASGIPMSTRSGNIDPAIGFYLHERYGLDEGQVNEMLQTHSGLLGISGFTADMHTLLQQRDHNDRARLAVDVFCYEASKAIASLSATVGGIDSIIFAGGIGERSAPIREQICTLLQYLGVRLDDNANQSNARLISSSDSQVGVHVIPTDESAMIANITKSVCNKENL